jgi:GDSL-like Lipase/Acylhydrolase.
MKEWLIRLALMSLGFIMAIVALEFGLSKFAPVPRTIRMYEPDKYIGYKGIPGKETKYGRRVGTVSYVKINSHGFRDEERTYEKKKGVFRIVVLGDSMTESVKVPFERTFPQVLEKKLNSGSDKRVEVINLGIEGFSTAQEYLTLKHYGLKYQPDFVILAFFTGNDVWDNSFSLAGESFRPYFSIKRRQAGENTL